MTGPRCDFYDWTSGRRCDQPGTWVTLHRSVRVPSRRALYYCDAHHPPRAHPFTAPAMTATEGEPAASIARPRARKRRG